MRREEIILTPPTNLDALSETKFLRISTPLLLAELSGYLVNRLPHILLHKDIGPLDPSAGVPEQSGVRWAFLAHHPMKFAANLFPTPRRFLLEAE